MLLRILLRAVSRAFWQRLWRCRRPSPRPSPSASAHSRGHRPGGVPRRPEQKTLELYVEKLNAAGGVLGAPSSSCCLRLGGRRREGARLRQAPDRAGQGRRASAARPPARPWPRCRSPKAPACPLILLAGAVVIIEPVKKWVFKTPHTDRMACEKIFVDMRFRGVAKAALISGAGGFDRSMRAECLKVASKGVQIVADETYGAGDTDMTAQLAKIKARPACRRC